MRARALLLVLVLHTASEAQRLDFSSVLSAETADAERYLGSYIGPFMEAFGYGLANGWVRSAKPLEPLRFDLTLTGSAAFVPNEGLRFEMSGYRRLRPDRDGRLPTIFGVRTQRRLSYSRSERLAYFDPETSRLTVQQGTLTGDFQAPHGMDLQGKLGAAFVPVPMVQAGVGLLGGTDGFGLG